MPSSSGPRQQAAPGLPPGCGGCNENRTSRTNPDHRKVTKQRKIQLGPGLLIPYGCLQLQDTQHYRGSRPFRYHPNWLWPHPRDAGVINRLCKIRPRADLPFSRTLENQTGSFAPSADRHRSARCSEPGHENTTYRAPSSQEPELRMLSVCI